MKRPYLILRCSAASYGINTALFYKSCAALLLIILFLYSFPGLSGAQTTPFSSNLPLVAITTKPGESIKNEPKVTADMKIIYNATGTRNYITDPANVYSGKVGIEIRGRYSASLPQKPYGFETRDVSGNNINVSLLGMPVENDWVLLANYNDKTFLRNVLAFELFREMGNYSVRTKFCEVLLNNEYQGIYILGEKIKQDSGRVNISRLKPEDNQGDDVSGGYIIKTDYYTANDSWLSYYSPLNKPGAKVYFVYHDPDALELTQPQKTYIQEYINSLETVLYDPAFRAPVFGYKSYIDINSFADYFIIGELSRNVDAYKKSRFFHKDKDSKGGLLYSGPVWDMDWAFRNLKENCVHMNKTDGSGWAYRINECSASPTPPSWEVRMLQDKEFANLVHTRYNELRKTILSKAHIEHLIDSVALLLNEAQVRHFEKWKILGINAGTPEWGIQPLTYEGEIIKLKSWLDTRLSWLDANMVGAPLSSENGDGSVLKFRVFPNPVSDHLFVESDEEMRSLKLFSLTGFLAQERSGLSGYKVELRTSSLKRGTYILKVEFRNGSKVSCRVVKE